MTTQHQSAQNRYAQDEQTPGQRTQGQHTHDHADLGQLPASDVAVSRLEGLRALLGSPAITQDVLDTMKALSPDPVNMPALIAWLNEGVVENDRRFEIRTALRCLARVLKPRSYLEIGTRRGWSLAQVLTEAPDCRAYSVDMWVEGYGSVANPGPGFVRSEIAKVAPGHRGALTFMSGNSHDVLPHFFGTVETDVGSTADVELTRVGEDRPSMFDLITVDGDHTALGAWWDLVDVFPHVALGGAVVFDDLLDTSDEASGATATTNFPELRPPNPTTKHSLLDLWRHVQSALPNFDFIEDLTAKPPIAIAIRMR